MIAKEFETLLWRLFLEIHAYSTWKEELLMHEAKTDSEPTGPAPVLGRLLSFLSECIFSSKTNKQTLHKSKLWGKEMFSTHSRPARPHCSPTFAWLIPIHQASGQMSPIPGGLPWLLCPKALSPPQHLGYLKLPVVSLYLLPVSSLLDSELYEGMDCAVLLCPLAKNNAWD